MNLPTQAGVEGRSRVWINTPLIAANKAATEHRASALGVDPGLRWSCYDPQPGRRPCGTNQNKRGGRCGQLTIRQQVRPPARLFLLVHGKPKPLTLPI
jgi:7-cyano-7-deazaguanine synthase in queuosine biosynthesis